MRLKQTGLILSSYIHFLRETTLSLSLLANYPVENLTGNNKSVLLKIKGISYVAVMIAVHNLARHIVSSLSITSY